MENKKTSLRFLWIALALCLVSVIGASIVQSSGNKVVIKDLRWETPSGHMMSALLYIPANATAESPAPAVVTSHGWYNNREMQDLNYVEWSRRGFVVMSIDMYGHGHSDAISPSEWQNAGTGMYDAVKLMAELPYVDKKKIGVSGHSNGARAANWSIKEDNLLSEPLIASVLLVANDAMYTTHPDEPRYTPFVKAEDYEPYTNNYGSRDVGIVAAQFDEFFFRTILEDGSRTVPGDYINTANAQSFLYFGADPKTKNEKLDSNTFYQKIIDGKEALRIIYNPYQIHPWNHVSTKVAAYGIEYFEKSFGFPRSIASSNQIWPIKLIFNFIGLIGFVMFIVSFTKVLLYSEAFSSLRSAEEVIPAPSPDKKGKIWFWGGSGVVALVAYISYLKVYNWTNTHRPDFFPQRPTYYIGIWSAIMGATILILLFITWRVYSKKSGMDLREKGIAMDLSTVVKTIGLALVVVASSFSLVFLADYFFKADFRIWALTVRTFTPDKISIAMKYAPFFLLYYVANSIAINSFNNFTIGSKEWINTAVVAGFAALAPAITIAIQYITFFTTGEVFYTGVSNIIAIWLFPIVVILPVGAIVSRKIYRASRNPYLPGIIMGLVATLIAVSNTLTRF